MSKKILICDDEEGIRESLKLILSDFYELETCTSGADVIDMLKAHPEIGLLLMDIKMPRQSGIETLKQVKKKFKHIPVIIVTGYRSVEAASEAIRLGASGYIVKPFKSKEIIATVRKKMNEIEGKKTE